MNEIESIDHIGNMKVQDKGTSNNGNYEGTTSLLNSSSQALRYVPVCCALYDFGFGIERQMCNLYNHNGKLIDILLWMDCLDAMDGIF